MSHLLSKGDLEKLRKLAKTAQIFSTHPVLLNGQSVEAGFDRGLRAIFVSHILWPKLDENAQRRLALHELLWFIDDRDADGSVARFGFYAPTPM